MIGLEQLARCHRCRSKAHVIEGDGPPICGVCILVLGRVARDPGNSDDFAVGTLAELHSDIVTLLAEDGVISWKWSPDWPGVGR